MATVIIALSPFIYATSRKPEDHAKFSTWARIWAKASLFLMGIKVVTKGTEIIKKDQLYVICANHASELDIMMTLAVVPNSFVFIGKKELAKFPIFGYFYKKTNVLVDRSSLSSKRRAMELASHKLKSGVGMCIFPEGGIPKKEGLAPFKMGAFKLAVDHGVPILTIAYPDNRKLFPDFMEGGRPGIARAWVLSNDNTKGLTEDDLTPLRDRTYQRIFDALNELRES